MPIAHTKDSLPLCEYLVARRRFLRMRLGDLAARTGLPPKYVKKIESGDWIGLPPGVYAKGFLRKYARVVGLDEGEVALRYDREWESLILTNAGRGLEQAGVKKEPPRVGRAGRLLKADLPIRKTVSVLLAAAVVVYIAWQFKVILERPDLSMDFPKEENWSSVEAAVEFLGRVSPGSVLTINGEAVYPEEDGRFRKSIELLVGLNVFEIKAASRFGKETKVVKRITYQQ